MSSKMLLSALAAVAAIAVIAAPQDPSFEYPGAKHVGFDVPKEEPALAPQVSERVSVSFKNASMREVLDWLKNQGVSFVVKDEQIDKDARVSINLVNRPVEDFMRALATAWEGHWTQEKDIWVFHEGRDPNAAQELFGKLDQTTPLTRIEGAPFMNPSWVEGAKGFGQLTPGKMTKEQQEEFKKVFEKMNDPRGWEEFQKKWEQSGKDYEKTWKNKEFQLDPKMMEEMQRKAFEMAKTGEKFQFEPGMKGFKWDGKDFKPLDEKQLMEMQKHALEMAKESQKWTKLGPNGIIIDGKNWQNLDEKQLKELEKSGIKVSKNGNEFRYEMKPLDEKQMKEMQQRLSELSKQDKFRYNFKPFDEKQLKELQKQEIAINKDGKMWRIDPKNMDEQRMKELEKAGIKVSRSGDQWRYEVKPLDQNKIRTLRGRALQDAKAGRKLGQFFNGPEVSTRTSSHNLKAIYDSLTPTQEQKLKRLGYINYSDLNSNQRAMLGVITDDSWTISYKTDKVNLTIKSDR
jgi:hypothetical protein